MKGFLEEYGLIIVVVAVILLMLLFGKTGYAKSIQDAILGSADHIVETGEGVTKGSDVKSSDTLNIEGSKYIVLEKQGNSQALVTTTRSIGTRAFQLYDRSDGQNQSTYEGCDIDNYLENTWYKGLSAKMQSAIQATNIKQASYAIDTDPDSKQETGPNGQVYNTISRHAFLPSVSEIGKVVDLKNRRKVTAFLNGGEAIWTRDSGQGNGVCAELLNVGNDWLRRIGVFNKEYHIRPAFVIDLSKVDYTEAGHVDYK